MVGFRKSGHIYIYIYIYIYWVQIIAAQESQAQHINKSKVLDFVIIIESFEGEKVDIVLKTRNYIHYAMYSHHLQLS